MSANPAKPSENAKYDPEKYWAERYKEIDLTKSGHVDLPEVYNRWLYRRKKERRLPGSTGGGQREVRDRRRARITGDFAPLAAGE